MSSSWITADYLFGCDDMDSSEESRLMRLIDRANHGSSYTSTELPYVRRGSETPTSKLVLPKKEDIVVEATVDSRSACLGKRKLQFDESPESSPQKSADEIPKIQTSTYVAESPKNAGKLKKN